jgi:Protein of unknown function (DUF2786)
MSSAANQPAASPNNSRILDKLRKVLALTNSPMEGEAQAALATLQRLLADYNLSMADLEVSGAAVRPGVKEAAHDLGKAAFAWKFDLADAMADHYFCWAITDRGPAKSVAFIGRPDNVESLKMLYSWVIDQIRRIASDERKAYLAAHPEEHIDPLRWQLHFGLGIVSRISDRLTEIRDRNSSKETSLVLSHRTEISDYMEEKYNRRVDGQPTKREQEWERQWRERQAAKAALKVADIEAYYNAYPWERPLTPEQQEEQAKEQAKADARYARNARRRRGRSGPRYTEADAAREEQAYTANRAGRKSADKVNLEPFLDGKVGPDTKGKLNDKN